jgi:hypothetical protein
VRVLSGGRAVDTDRVERGDAQGVVVVDEARDDRPAPGVDDLDVTLGGAAYVLVGADRGDPAPAHQHCSSDGVGAVDGADVRVDDGDVARLGHGCLRFRGGGWRGRVSGAP